MSYPYALSALTLFIRQLEGIWPVITCSANLEDMLLGAPASARITVEK